MLFAYLYIIDTIPYQVPISHLILTFRILYRFWCERFRIKLINHYMHSDLCNHFKSLSTPYCLSNIVVSFIWLCTANGQYDDRRTEWVKLLFTLSCFVWTLFIAWHTMTSRGTHFFNVSGNGNRSFFIRVQWQPCGLFVNRSTNKNTG